MHFVKIFNTLEDGNNLNVVKNIYKNPTTKKSPITNIILNGEILNASP